MTKDNNIKDDDDDEQHCTSYDFAASLSRKLPVKSTNGTEDEKTAVISDNKVTTSSYTLRGLKEDEVEKWAAFCASVFSYKANPPPAAYFARHYYNDPYRGDASLIRVATVVNNNNNNEDQEDEIVASCRIFQRSITNGSSSLLLAAGGIGEVCTSSNHRRRGLSKELLKDCIDIMTHMNMSVSFLHAAPAFFPVYQSAGYVGTTSCWSVVKILGERLSSSTTSNNAALPKCTVRLADFPADTDQLMAMHQSLVSQQGFAGCIVRSKEYWNTYISQEMQDSLWVLEAEEKEGQNDDAHSTRTNTKIVAWLSIRPRGETRLQLREFGYCVDRQRADSAFVSTVLSMLLQGQKLPSSFELQLPTFVVEQLDETRSPFIDWNQKAATENDEGWMYRPLQQPQESSSSAANDKLHHEELLLPPDTWKKHSIPHLIWPADSF